MTNFFFHNPILWKKKRTMAAPVFVLLHALYQERQLLMQMPADYQTFRALSSEQVQRLYDVLLESPLDSQTVDQWLKDWGDLETLFQESMARYDVTAAVHTADAAAQAQLDAYRTTIMPINMRMYQQLQARMQAHADLLP